MEINYAIGSAIATVATQVAGMQIRVQPFSGTSQALPQLNTGEIDFAIDNISEMDFAIKGKTLFARPNPNLRMIAVLFPYYVSIAVRKDSPMKAVSDLRGHKMTIGFKGQKIAGALLEAILANAGLKDSDLKGIPVPSVIRSADEFAAGNSDGFFFAITGGGKVAETDASVGGIRWLNLDNSPAAIGRMQAVLPATYIATLKPSKRWVGIHAPTYVMADLFGLIVNANTPDDVVYKITKTIYENQKELVQIHKSFGQFEPKAMAPLLDGVQYHPGAIKFYKEEKMWPPTKKFGE